MSVTSGFYDSLNGDRKYGILELSSIFDGVISNGVYASIGKHLVVRASDPASMQVIVGSGRAWFNHSWVVNDVDYPLYITESDAVLNRIDTIVLEINRGDTVRAARIFVKNGSLASNPVPASLTNDRTMTQIPLAYISVSSKATKIYASNINNKVGTSACPFVTGVVSSVSTDELVTKWEADFENLFAQLRTQIDQVVQGAIPDGSVSSMYHVDIVYDHWWQESYGYHKEFTIPGIKATDNPIIDVDFTKISGETAKQEILEEWSNVYNIITKDGSIIVYTTDHIKKTIPIKLLCVRK